VEYQEDMGPIDVMLQRICPSGKKGWKAVLTTEIESSTATCRLPIPETKVEADFAGKNYKIYQVHSYMNLIAAVWMRIITAAEPDAELVAGRRRRPAGLDLGVDIRIALLVRVSCCRHSWQDSACRDRQ